MGDIFGKLFQLSTFGESHGQGVGVIVSGCPAGLYVSQEMIQQELDRRRPGQSKITTPRNESDRVLVQSGIMDNLTLGTAISLFVANNDAQSSSYEHLRELYRPSHADYTYDQRFGCRDWRGGGRASSRETIGRVAAGAIAKALLKELIGLETLAWVEQVQFVSSKVDMETVTSRQVESNIVRCPDSDAANKMIEIISAAKNDGNSLGGIIRFRVKNCLPGLGDPVFDKLTADLAKALMSIPATRSVSFGMGEKAIDMTGWEHNDPLMVDKSGKIRTETNYAGGIVGGISNGEIIYGTVAFKPTATINREQNTVTRDGKAVHFQGKGRHDPCVLPRAVPIVEAMINLVLADHLLRFSICNMNRLKRIFAPL